MSVAMTFVNIPDSVLFRRDFESIAADILTGYPGVKTEALAEARGGTADEDEAIVTPLFPARFRARSVRVA